jgi:hypothetical protein
MVQAIVTVKLPVVRFSTSIVPGNGRNIITLPVRTPVNLRTAFCDCVGPGDGVIEPGGEVSVTFAFERLIVCTPPRKPSTAERSGFNAVLPQVPTRSPVFGMINATLTVVGSVISVQ